MYCINMIFFYIFCYVLESITSDMSETDLGHLLNSFLIYICKSKVFHKVKVIWVGRVEKSFK